jgi:hypothetical protein
VLLIGVTPLTATAFPIYESATAASPGLRGDSPEERMNVTQLQSIGVKFYCHVCEDGSKPVTTGSIGGYLAELTEYTKSEIIGAIVKLEEGPLVTAQLTDVDNGKVSIGQKVEMVTRKLREDGERGMLVYGYKFRPGLISH